MYPHRYYPFRSLYLTLMAGALTLRSEANLSKIKESSSLNRRTHGRASERPNMADSIFPTLRMAFNQALGGIRLGFGRITASPKPVSPEADGFLTRLEEVLGIELQEAEPAPQPQHAPAEPVAVARVLLPVPAAVPAIHTQPVAQPAVKPRRKRKAAEKADPTKTATGKAAGGKKRAGKSAPRAKREKKR